MNYLSHSIADIKTMPQDIEEKYIKNELSITEEKNDQFTFSDNSIINVKGTHYNEYEFTYTDIDKEDYNIKLINDKFSFDDKFKKIINEKRAVNTIILCAKIYEIIILKNQQKDKKIDPSYIKFKIPSLMKLDEHKINTIIGIINKKTKFTNKLVRGSLNIDEPNINITKTKDEEGINIIINETKMTFDSCTILTNTEINIKDEISKNITKKN